MKLWLCIAVFLLQAFAAPCSLQAVFEQEFGEGVAAFNSGDYQAALEHFKQIEQSGIAHPRLYYNLGNCYYKLDLRGLAVAHYLMAQRLDPRNDDISANLDFVRSTLRDKFEDSLQNPIWAFVRDTALSFRADELTWILFLLYLLAIAVLIFSILRIGKNLVLAIALFSLIGVMLVGGALLAVNIKMNYFTPQAVIVEPEVEVLAGPGAIGDIRFTAHEGLTFRILRQESGYYEGIFANRLKGWVKVSQAYQF